MELGTTWVGTSTLLAALDVQDGEWARAEEEIAEARRVWAQHRLDGGIATAWSLAVSAFFHARAGAAEEARRDIERVEAMIARYASPLPWVRVVVDSFLTRAYVALGEEAAAVSTLRRVREILDRVETSAFLTALAVAAEQSLRRADALKSLSPAELRLWPHAAGRGTVREIGAALHVSPETVKTQLSSIYRKLGVRSRRELQELAESLEA
jgi:LuxR family maltose regulon positive regulatory protein